MFRKITATVKVLENPRGKVLAYADIVIDQCLEIKNYKVIDGANGLFISNPSYKTANGNFQDIVIPMTDQVTDHINSTILDMYEVESAVI